MLDKADAVIIGGGVMGTSTAYHLGKRGCRDVVLLEKNTIASGSTGKSVGVIRQEFSTESNIRITMESRRFLERFAEELETEIELRQPGYIFVATTEEDWQAFQSQVVLQRSLGLEVDLLSPAQIREIAPYLNLDDVLGGTFCPTDGYADPYSVAMGFAKGARRLGAMVHEGTEATGIEVKAGKVTAVCSKKGRIATPVVVNAAGPWAADVGRMAGAELPVKPYRRQVFVTGPFEALPGADSFPIHCEMPSGLYFRREGAGILIGMSDQDEPSSFNTNLDWGFLTKVVERAMQRVPVLESAGFMDGWAGLYAITPDANPIIARNVGGVEGFYCAVGFSGHGFMQGPVVGRILADLITGNEIDIDLHPFELERLERGVIEGEKRVI